MKHPQVTISIPSYNNDKKLELCLLSIKHQTYKNIEVNIVYGSTKDKTQQIAKAFGIKTVKFCKGSLLKSRYEGVKLAKGKYILILDSDQILDPSAIARAIELAEKHHVDMVALEETVYKKNTFLEKLFYCDRKVINSINNLDPFTGVILPRFFRSALLKKAYAHIPKSYFKNTGGPDHAIVYYEAWLLSKKVDILPQAVKHIEPSSMVTLWKKFYRWGYTSVDAHLGKYRDLMEKKERFRTGLFTKGLIIESIGSILLLILKGIPFRIGYYVALSRKLSQ